MAGGRDVAGRVQDDAIAVITQSEVVCETCGSGSAPHLIANCARCNAYQHWYCFSTVLTFVIPLVWFCYRCQRNANRADRSESKDSEHDHGLNGLIMNCYLDAALREANQKRLQEQAKLNGAVVATS
ncbi:hypothetical protein EJB05_06088 [Eragrostis curvula]|uniref:Zinc finger PHD-type domain-containing protein n=1 Tax=Eragrostis curvula TaxID=38414 RepID=A0A5J9WFB2_9POAL|nr:hypothetical protein EJB05_06088 [Eragrostis curvula]